MPTYFFDDGRPSRHPVTKDHAVDIGSPLYNDGERCTECNVATTKYTSNDECIHCCRKIALNFFNFHNQADFVWTDEETGEHFAEPERNGKLMQIDESTWLRWTELSKLVDSDAMYTVSPEQCKQHGHIGMKRLGKCYECHLEKNKPSPRQEAMAKGEKYFMPLKPCPRCNKIALKRINGSVCTGCIETDVSVTDNRETPDTIMMRDNPDMVISKADAKAYDFKVYRTGEPCRKGHKGWRYVSTGNCISCIKGE